MDKRLLPELPLWATMLHVVMVAVAVTAILIPQARVPIVGHVLGLGSIALLVLFVVRLKRAGALQIGLRDYARHTPSNWTPREVLEVVALFLAGWVVTFTL
jgi:hypothetical protein